MTQPTSEIKKTRVTTGVGYEKTIRHDASNLYQGNRGRPFPCRLQLNWPLPAWAESAANGIDQIAAKSRYALTIGCSPFTIDGRKGVSTGVNGSVPGPLISLIEGDDVILNVTNALAERMA